MRGLRALSARLLYRLGMGLAAPSWLLAQALRRRVPPEGLRERLALRPPSFPLPPLWLHGASLGEVGVAATLAAGLREEHPGLPLLLTAFTETGRARAEGVMGVTARRLPLDLPWIWGRFLGQVRPRALWVVETELWPELLIQAHRRGVPVGVVNARLSARALSRYRRLGFFAHLVRDLAAVAARSEEDAQRWRSLGVPAERLRVTGNIKFDRVPSTDLAQRSAAFRRLFGGRPVWVAGSVRPAEEAAVLAALQALRGRHPDLLLVWAPRHPERFEAVHRRLQAAAVPHARRSRGEPVGTDTQVLLLDTLGELEAVYGAGDMAFVGGSLSPEYGGHSPLEPAALGRPVLMGPHRAHFSEEAAALEAAGGLETVGDAAALERAVARWLDRPELRERAGRAARAAVEAHRGARERTLAWMRERGLLPPAISATTD